MWFLFAAIFVVAMMYLTRNQWSQGNDIDVARVPILLPQSIYQVDHREYIYAQTGGELYGDVPLTRAAQRQLTRGLKGANMPSGLCCQVQAWSS